jgi:hypothetical protein
MTTCLRSIGAFVVDGFAMRSKGQPVRPNPGSPAEPTPRRPERWAVDAGARDVAQLTVPPDAKRDRVFELFCCLHVRTAPGRDDAWHSLRLLVNGAQEWSRRVPTDAGGRDSLDYRFRRVVPSGEALRVVATTELHGAVCVKLAITAEEDA